MAAIRVYDWNGTVEELAQLLENGIQVKSATRNARGTFVKVEFDKPVKRKVGKPAKYTTEQLQAMYDAYTTTDKTMTEIAKEYGCSRPYVSKVVNRIASEHGVDLSAERGKEKL